MRLDTATCVYKCSLYTVGGCIYKLGKFVMANWYVAGIYSGIICIQKCIQYIYIRYIFRNSEIQVFRNIISDTFIYIVRNRYMFREFMFIYINIGIYSEIYIIS